MERQAHIIDGAPSAEEPGEPGRFEGGGRHVLNGSSFKRYNKSMSNEIDALLTENRKFAPSSEFRSAAHVADDSLHRRAAQDPEAFWAEQASQLDWFRKWDRVLDWKPPHAKWFAGGKLNVSVNCV